MRLVTAIARERTGVKRSIAFCLFVTAAAGRRRQARLVGCLRVAAGTFAVRRHAELLSFDHVTAAAPSRAYVRQHELMRLMTAVASECSGVSRADAMTRRAGEHAVGQFLVRMNGMTARAIIRRVRRVRHFDGVVTAFAALDS
jgi:hypothetical protein